MGRVVIHRDGSVSSNMYSYMKVHGRNKVASVMELPEPLRGAVCTLLAAEPTELTGLAKAMAWRIDGVGWAKRGAKGTIYVQFFIGWSIRWESDHAMPNTAV